MNGMRPNAMFVWLSVLVPACGGVVTFLTLRRRGVSSRRREMGAMLVTFWLFAVFMSVSDGRLDPWSLLFFLPVVTVWAIAIDASVRWLDRMRGRDW